MYLKEENKIWIATGEERVYLLPSMANRHGLIAGATGTGKTVTLKVLAESFSDMGVPVFLADIKGDVSGLSIPGVENKNVEERIQSMKIENFAYTGYPVRFFDLFEEKGIPVRTTISHMGPELLSRILQLNDVQAGVLNVVFRIADDKGLLLIDIKDLRAMLQYVAEQREMYQTNYGNIATQSIGAIQRALVKLEDSGAEQFFGEPELDLKDWMTTDGAGRGMINLLHCVKLVQSPLLYSTFLLWMLSDLYEMLPEAGDLEKPKMIFFFDEAHLLFADAPKALLQKVEQVTRLIRSKGVGIYFITQTPSDIPDSVLGQLGNKIQHALRAYTPKDQKAVKAAAAAFRTNPAFDSETALSELGTGEALISILDEKGAPTMVQRAFVLPPSSFMGVAEDANVQSMIHKDPLYTKYGQAVDRESAYETLDQVQKEEEDTKIAAIQAEEAAKLAEKQQAEAQKQQEKEAARIQKQQEKDAAALKREVTKTISSFGRQVGSEVIRGLFGTKKKKR